MNNFTEVSSISDILREQAQEDFCITYNCTLDEMVEVGEWQKVCDEEMTHDEIMDFIQMLRRENK